MSILKYKYKAHRLVNTLFYVIVFVIGFLLGFTSNIIDFSKLLSQVLMIDNVSAYTIYEDENVVLNEEYIYNEFLKLDSKFDISTYKNIYCSVIKDNNGTNIECYAFSDYFFESATFTKVGSGWYYSVKPGNGDFYYFHKISPYSSNYLSSVPSDLPSVSSITFMNYKSDNYPGTAYNFDVPGHEDIFSNYKTLDFISSTLKFNENLFKDNPDFKEVCVDSSKYFVISSDEYINNNTIFADFLWFPYGLYGLYQASYSTYENKILYVDDESSTYHYYFSNKDVIDEKFDENSGLKYLLYDNSYYSYDNRYLYYGWTAYPFSVSYSETSTHIPVYYFENPISYSSIGNNIHGGSGSRLEFDDGLEEPLEYCFYIKNNYFIEYLEADEFGDYYGSIIIPDGTLDISSTNNKDDISSGGLMSQVNKFINEIKDTINFIRENIYNFYLSMPLLLRMFLISIFVILIVKLIIGMVVK